MALNADAYPKVDEMLSRFAVRNRWNEEVTARVRAVGEKTLLLREGEQAQPRDDWVCPVLVRQTSTPGSPRSKPGPLGSTGAHGGAGQGDLPGD